MAANVMKLVAMAMAMVILAGVAVKADDHLSERCIAKCEAECLLDRSPLCVSQCLKECGSPVLDSLSACTFDCSNSLCNKFTSDKDTLKGCVNSCFENCNKKYK